MFGLGKFTARLAEGQPAQLLAAAEIVLPLREPGREFAETEHGASALMPRSQCCAALGQRRRPRHIEHRSRKARASA
ncbi:MAG: hypothetical protein AAFV96_13625, partial [Pseudomonadota bacterium]